MRSDRVAFAIALLVALAHVGRVAHAQTDPMAEYRERFKTGLTRYQDGATAEALQWWEPIYRELGPERGWRLAFNLGRAYDGLGDATHAVERYEAFLSQVEARRTRGEAIEELIEREAKEARTRAAELAAVKGRLMLRAGAAPRAVKIDGSEPRLAGFTAYVAPGVHTVVFEPGTPREARRTVEVAAGESVDLAAEEPVAEPPVDPPRPSEPPRVATAPSEPRTVERPFPSIVLWIAGGATVASVIVPVITYRSAIDFQENNRLSGDSDALAQVDNGRVRASYDAHKTTYYATLAIPATLAVASGALTGWYFLGSRMRDAPIASGAVGVSPSGVSLKGRF